MSKEFFTIANKKIYYEEVELKQAELKFYAENPRVYTLLYSSGGNPTQNDIEELMCNQEHVKSLKEDIERNGGLIESLIVRGGDYVVIEGNSRLAAYRLLANKDPVKWGMIKCRLLPDNISDEDVFKIIGNVHLKGKKDWDPYEQASYLERSASASKKPTAVLAEEIGISKKEAENMIATLNLMKDFNDNEKRHWSYYNEFVKSPSIKEARKAVPGLTEAVCNSIKDGSMEKATDIRNLTEIAKVNDKSSHKVLEKISIGKMTIKEGYEQLNECGKMDDAFKKLSKFRTEIAKESFHKQLLKVKDKNKVQFEINKIIKNLNSLKIE